MDPVAAQQLYDASVALLLATIRQGRRGLYRVMMAPEGLIESVAPARASTQRPTASASAVAAASACHHHHHHSLPAQTSFTLFISGDANAPPRLGPLDALSPLQRRLAELLLQDTLRLLRAAQVAYALQRGDSPVLRAHGDSSVERLARRFGQLPEPALKREDEASRASAEAQRVKETERKQAWDAVRPTVFEEMLRREQRLEQKRRCKKQAAAAARERAKASAQS